MRISIEPIKVLYGEFVQENPVKPARSKWHTLRVSAGTLTRTLYGTKSHDGAMLITLYHYDK